MANTYDIGDQVRVTVTFSVGGINTDPTTITLKVKDPSHNVDTYTYALGQLVKSATGIYYKDISIDEAGIWHYRFEGTGAVISADEDYFQVDYSAFS